MKLARPQQTQPTYIVEPPFNHHELDEHDERL